MKAIGLVADGLVHKHIVKHIDDAAMMTYRLSAVAFRLNLAANHPELESSLPLLLISSGPRTRTSSLTLLCVPLLDGVL